MNAPAFDAAGWSAVLVLGLALCALATAAVCVVRRAAHRSRQLEAANFLLQGQIEQRRRAEQELARLNRNLLALSECTQVLVHAPEEWRLLQQICDVLVERCGYRLAWVGYAEADPCRTVRVVAVAGEAKDYIHTGMVSWDDTERGRGPTGTAIRTGRVTVCDDTLTDPGFAPWRQRALERGFRSCVALPLLMGGKPMGALSLYAPTPAAFADQELLLLSQFALDLAFGIQSVRNRAEHQRNEERLCYLASIVEDSEDAIYSKSLDGTIVTWNRGAERMYGYTAEEAISRNISFLLPPERTDETFALLARIAAGQTIEHYETLRRCKDGACRDVSLTLSPLHDRQGQVVGAAGIGRDISARKRAERELATRLRQQAAVAEISQLAVAGTELQPVLERAVELLAATLEVEYCKVLELLPGGAELLLRAGVGWKPGLVGQARVSAGADSQAGYTLLSEAPVIVEDLPRETRFRGPPLLQDHGVVSGMSVVIRHAAGVFGVLGAHSTRPRRFSGDDVCLLQALANLLGQALARKQAERRLYDQQFYTRSLIEASLDPLMTTDAAGLLTDVNQQMELLTGWLRADLIGSQFQRFCTEPERAGEGIRRVLRDGKLIDYELTVRHRDGHHTVVSYNATLFRDGQGQVAGVFAAARDITQRKRAELQLRRASRYARTLLEASLDPLVTISKEGRIMDVNQATEAVTGLPRHALLGTDFCDYFTAPDQARAGYLQVFAQGLVRDYPLAIRHLSGRLTEVLYNAVSYYDESGQTEGVFAAARDITQRKRAEQELQHYAAALARSNADLQDFAAIASHDLQEPLRKVLAFGEQLQEHCGEQLDELGRDFLGRMRNAAARMSDLIEALLQYSRVSSRAQPFQPVDLQQVALEVMADLETSIQQAHAQVTLGTLPRLVADPTQIRQLLQNLLSNAIKFHLPGARPHVLVDSRPVGNGACQPCRESGVENGDAQVPGLGTRDSEPACWQIRVQDNGIGFEERHLERIFRPFQRLHGRNEFPGSGMGLAICRKIVARHGGALTATSQPGQGATFLVTLPAVTEECLTADSHGSTRIGIDGYRPSAVEVGRMRPTAEGRSPK